MPDKFPLPVLSMDQANAQLTKPGAPFEIIEEIVEGRSIRAFKGIPRHFRELFDNLRNFREREYLVHDDERVTYNGFSRAVVTLAHRLQADGIERGDRVAIIMRNMPEWFVAFYGAILSGAIVTPLNSWWTGPELEYGLQNSEARVAIVDRERLAVIAPHLDACEEIAHVYLARTNEPTDDGRIIPLEQIIGRPDTWASLQELKLPDIDFSPDDEVAIFYTSGTTGRPKGAVATHRNILTNVASAKLPVVRSALRWSGALPAQADPASQLQRVNLLAVPLFHATGMVAQLVIAPNSGSKVVMMRRWNAAEAAQLIEKERVWATGGVPTIVQQLLEEAERTDADLSSLVSLMYGGAPAPAELTRLIRQAFPKVQMATGWGMTETMSTVTSAAGLEYETHPASAGPPVPVSDIEIRDPDDGRTVLPTGAVGELWARGPQIVKGYWKRPNATAETFVDGWLRTGDLARVDEEGYVYIVDRAKDMVIRGGENIYCLEVENAIFDQPDVLEAAVFGIPHPVLGEEPVAVVRLAASAELTEEELKLHVAARIARFKVPARVWFSTEELPRNANGKILKSEVRAKFADL